MKSSANPLNAALLIEIPRTFPETRLWRNNRVEAKAIGRGGRLRHISAGIDGQGDLSGIHPVMIGSVRVGIRLEVETKTTDRLLETQKAFRDMIVGAGGIYIEARSVEQCIEELRGRA